MFQKNKTQLRFVSLEERIVFDASGVIFVDATVAAGGDGSSWAQAYNNLDSALAAASTSVGGDQLWIADGVYKPSQIYSPNGVVGGAAGLNETQLMTFNLPDDVQLYGGFKGNESSLDQRNPLVFMTILSGDILSNDISNRLDSGFSASKADNVWHVVTAGNDISLTGVNASLNGLTIMGGFADGPTDGLSGSIYSHDSGGAVYAHFGSVINFEKAIIKDNVALRWGGGLYATGDGTTLNVEKSIFNNNAAIGLIIDGRGGGAISANFGAETAVDKSLFTNNYGGEDGGAIYLLGGSADISRSVFSNNLAERSGGAISSITQFYFGEVHVNVTDSLFVKNQALSTSGGAIAVADFVGNPNNSLTISNTDFIQNSGPDVGGAVFITDRNASINSSNFIGNSAETYGGGLSVASIVNAYFNTPFRSTVTVTDSNFVNNEVGNNQAFFDIVEFILPFTTVEGKTGGGAISTWMEANLIVDNSTFINNRAAEEGGAILSGGLKIDLFGTPIGTADHTIITNSSFVNNRAQGNGGAIAAESVVPYTSPGAPTLTLSGSTLKANDASGNGGALYLTDYTTSITSNVFYKSNDADMLGDQVYAKDTLLNSVDSGAPGAKNALKLVNVFKNLDNDDLYLI